jgi:hypothetical protein
MRRKREGGDREETAVEERVRRRREVLAVACGGGGTAAASNDGLAPMVATTSRVEVKDWGDLGVIIGDIEEVGRAAAGPTMGGKRAMGGVVKSCLSLNLFVGLISNPLVRD